MDIEGAIAAAADTPIDNGDSGETQPRDYEAEARAHGWTPKEEFRGDPNKWVDSETFIRRADEVMPFLKKQNAALKREMDDLKRDIKRASAHFEKAEERGYQRAMAELDAKLAEAVQTGDEVGAKAAVRQMRDLEREASSDKGETTPAVDEAQKRQELADWIDRTGWYGADEQKTKYADLQADLMGPAQNYPGGQAKWLTDLEAKVERKFAAAKPGVANPGGGRPGAKAGTRSYNDLPAAAKAMCDKWVKNGIIKNREAYVASYQWDN